MSFFPIATSGILAQLGQGSTAPAPPVPTEFQVNSSHSLTDKTFEIANHADFDVTEFSVGCWINKASSGSAVTIMQQKTVIDFNAVGWALDINAGQIGGNTILVDNAGVSVYHPSLTGTVTNDQDTHIMMTFKVTTGNNDWHIYIDGVDVTGTVQESGGALGQITMNTNMDIRPHGISIANFMFADRAFTPAEVLDLANSGVMECYEDLPTSITDDVKVANRFGNWDDNLGSELDDISGNSHPATNPSAIGFDQTQDMKVLCAL